MNQEHACWYIALNVCNPLLKANKHVTVFWSSRVFPSLARVLFPVWLGETVKVHSAGSWMVVEIVLIEPYNLMRCRKMIPLFFPCNFIYSVLVLDVNESKSMLKPDFEIFLSKLVFPSSSRLFFIHSDFIVLIYLWNKLGAIWMYSGVLLDTSILAINSSSLSSSAWCHFLTLQ